jgi:hypothetical protein
MSSLHQNLQLVPLLSTQLLQLVTENGRYVTVPHKHVTTYVTKPLGILKQIKVTQIECESIWKAPNDCVQYHTGLSGTFRSFNHPTGLITQNSQYSICIRQEEGHCGIAYSTNVLNNQDAFQLSDGAGSKVCRKTQRLK